MLLSTKDHIERVTHEGLSNIYKDLLLGHNDRMCSDFVCSLVKVIHTRFARLQVSVWNILCLQENLSVRLILDARRENPTFQGTSQVSNGNLDSFSRAELLVGRG